MQRQGAPSSSVGGRSVILWLEANTCTGDFLSLLNALNPDVHALLTEHVDLRFSNVSMAAEGNVVMETLFDVAHSERRRYILAVEGCVATRDDGLYGVIGHRADGSPVTQLEAVQYLAKHAWEIVAVGTCASSGGPNAAWPNPSVSQPVHKVTKRRVINVPGCPAHPDWVVGTLIHPLRYGVPVLDRYNRPLVYYGSNIHENCPRRQFFENGAFADHPGDEGCTYLVGCKGPVTCVDRPTRGWIGLHLSWPVEANTPCIGCMNPGFPDEMSPFFEHPPDVRLPYFAVSSRAIALAVTWITVGTIGALFIGDFITGRLGTGITGHRAPIPFPGSILTRYIGSVLKVSKKVGK